MLYVLQLQRLFIIFWSGSEKHNEAKKHADEIRIFCDLRAPQAQQALNSVGGYCINKSLDDTMRSNVIKHRKIYFLIVIEFY